MVVVMVVVVVIVTVAMIAMIVVIMLMWLVRCGCFFLCDCSCVTAGIYIFCGHNCILNQSALLS